MFFSHILITYTKQYNRTIQRRRKTIKRCLLPRVKSWFYPNKVRCLLNFSVKNSFFCSKFWTCLDNVNIKNIYYWTTLNYTAMKFTADLHSKRCQVFFTLYCKTKRIFMNIKFLFFIHPVFPSVYTEYRT